jgi:hypothetical protein
MKKLYLSLALMAIAGLSIAQNAKVQVIHNSADTAAQNVDIYLDAIKILDNFQFRRASPFVEVPAGTPITIGIAPGTSSSAADTIASFSFTLDADEKYVIVANGMVSQSGYNPMQPFVLSVFDMGRDSSSQASNTDVLVLHGSTDAPSVDIVERNQGMLVENISYGEFSDDYLELPTANYILEVRPTGDTNAVASFTAPLQTLNLQGKAIVVIASGFLNPANNSNGSPFGLWVALPTGGALVQLQAAPMSIEKQVLNTLNIWPNPTAGLLNYSLGTGVQEAKVELLNLSGQVVKSEMQKNIQNNATQTLDINELPSGIYFFSIKTENEVVTKKVMKF